MSKFPHINSQNKILNTSHHHAAIWFTQQSKMQTHKKKYAHVDSETTEVLHQFDDLTGDVTNISTENNILNILSHV